MIPETSVNWKAFEYIYSDNPQGHLKILLIICSAMNSIRKMVFFVTLISHILKQIRFGWTISLLVFNLNITQTVLPCLVKKVN